jgi:hypothetical protein
MALTRLRLKLLEMLLLSSDHLEQPILNKSSVVIPNDTSGALF